MNVDLYNLKGEKIGTVDVPDAIFGVAWKPALVHQVVIAQQANARRPWAHAKDRSEVRGGGKKPWRQKGTGRARHGSIRSPLWSGGGKAHGPTKNRSYEQKVNKKMKKAALFSVLSKKLVDGEIRIVERLPFDTGKTKELASRLTQFFNLSKRAKKYDALIIPVPGNAQLSRAASNLVKTKVLSPTSLNVYDILNHKHLLIDQNAVSAIQSHYSR